MTKLARNKTTGLYDSAEGFTGNQEPWIVCTDAGSFKNVIVKNVIVIGVAVDAAEADAVATKMTTASGYTRRFWFHRTQTHARAGLLTAGAAIRYGYPVERAANDADEWLVGSTFEERLKAGMYTAPVELSKFNQPLYTSIQNDCWSRFKADLAHEVGMANHPMFEKMYAKAYEKGHSGGMSEVLNEARDLSEMFR